MLAVFASGNVRHGSVKRAASAVVEGSIAIQLIHSLVAADHRRRQTLRRNDADVPMDLQSQISPSVDIDDMLRGTRLGMTL
jgi:hypothetical protein